MTIVEKALQAEHIDDAKRLSAAMRELTDAVVRALPGAHSAEVAEQISALVDTLTPHVVDGFQPWAYALNHDDRQQLISLTATERSNAAGTTWTSFNPVSPPLDLQMEGRSSRGTVTLGPVFGGPPGRVHGGTLATLIDHAMGALLFHLDRSSYTARLELSYLAGAPLGEALEVEATVDRIEGRKTFVSARIDVDGEPAVRAEALFVTMAR